MTVAMPRRWRSSWRPQAAASQRPFHRRQLGARFKLLKSRAWKRPPRRRCHARGGGLRPPAAAFEVRLGHGHLTTVETSKRTLARILPSSESSTSATMSRARRRPAAAFEVRLGHGHLAMHGHLTIVEASKRTFAGVLPSSEASTSATMPRARRRPAAAFEVRLGHGHLTMHGHLIIVEASKRALAGILPSLISCEAVPRQRR